MLDFAEILDGAEVTLRDKKVPDRETSNVGLLTTALLNATAAQKYASRRPSKLLNSLAACWVQAPQEVKRIAHALLAMGSEPVWCKALRIPADQFWTKKEEEEELRALEAGVGPVPKISIWQKILTRVRNVPMLGTSTSPKGGARQPFIRLAIGDFLDPISIPQVGIAAVLVFLIAEPLTQGNMITAQQLKQNELQATTALARLKDEQNKQIDQFKQNELQITAALARLREEQNVALNRLKDEQNKEIDHLKQNDELQKTTALARLKDEQNAALARLKDEQNKEIDQLKQNELQITAALAMLKEQSARLQYEANLNSARLLAINNKPPRIVFDYSTTPPVTTSRVNVGVDQKREYVSVFFDPPGAHQAIIDSYGMPFYTLDKKANDCDAKCAASYLPFLVWDDSKNQNAFYLLNNGALLTGDKLTVITRGDGLKQWAYQGDPLYFYKPW
jgi:hypothetical protein